MALLLLVGVGLSKVIRVRYEKGILKPLEPLDLEEGMELQVVLLAPRRPRKDRERIVEKYKGFMGTASREEIDKLLLEAEFESF